MVAVPDADALTTRFPEFADTDPDAIDAAIEEAARSVDSTWLDDDFQLGILLLAAHILFVGAENGNVLGKSSTLRIGPFSESVSAGASDSFLEGSSYGQRYLRLVRANHPPIVVI